jgi:AraC-like DNA-binding protein
MANRETDPASAPMSNSTIPGKYVSSLLRNLRQRGIDLAELLADIGIAIDIQGRYQVPGQVEAALYTRVYKFYLQHMRGEHFALAHDSGHPAGKYQALCMIIADCDKLGTGLRRSQDFYGTFGTEPGSFELVETADKVELRLTQPLRLAAARRPVVAANILVSIRRTLEQLVGRHLPLVAVHLEGEIAAHPDKYLELFKGDVHFASDRNSIVFLRDVLDYPIVHTAESVMGLLDQLPGRLFDTPDQEDDSLSTRIRRRLGFDLSRSLPSQELLARDLGMSASSLRRQLAREGTSFQALKQEVREQKARELLRNPAYSLAEVAQMLGFPATTAFHRAFRQWTGTTPGDYRRSVNDGGGS